MVRLLMRLCLPDKAFRWPRPGLTVAYVDLILRREYLPVIREQLNAPPLFLRLPV